MKAKLLRRIRENWNISFESGKTFPNMFAESKNKLESYEYSWFYKTEFIFLLLKLSKINCFSRMIKENRYLTRKIKMQRSKSIIHTYTKKG